MKAVRRFLIAPSLSRLARRERGSARLTEGYFATQSGRNSHVLIEGSQCQLVLVVPGANGVAAEERTDVPRAHADALLDVCAGRAVFDRTRPPPQSRVEKILRLSAARRRTHRFSRRLIF